MEDLVSVIITSYNSDYLFLKKAIESVQSQTYNKLEIILVDDGSSNNIAKKISENYSNINYIYQNNKGLASARNTGVKASKGKYICFLDDDDYWNNKKIEKQVEFFKLKLKVDPKCSMIFTHQINISEDDVILGYVNKVCNGNVKRKLYYGNVIGAPSSAMIIRKLFEFIELFNENFRCSEDIELWYRIADKYSIYSLNEHLIYYRVRKNSLSKNVEQMNFYSEKALRKALENDKEITDYIKKDILANYYIKVEMTRAFNVNNSKFVIKSYKKGIKINKMYIFKIKYLIKALLAVLGDNMISKYNYIKIRSKG